MDYFLHPEDMTATLALQDDSGNEVKEQLSYTQLFVLLEEIKANMVSSLWLGDSGMGMMRVKLRKYSVEGKHDENPEEDGGKHVEAGEPKQPSGPAEGTGGFRAQKPKPAAPGSPQTANKTH